MRAHVYDEAILHAGQGGLLDLVRKDLDNLQEEVSWTLVVPGPKYRFNVGDYNGDHRIDAADHSTWRDSVGDSVESYNGADGDGSGVIDAGDYQTWRRNYGRTRETLTLIDADTANGSFEELAGGSLPRVANGGHVAIPGWTADTTFFGVWHDQVAGAASEGVVYSLTAASANTLLTSDSLGDYVTSAGDLFTLAVDAASLNGTFNDYELFLLFGEQTRAIGAFS